MKRVTIESMIKEDLGYCCLWAFFTRNKKTGMIAMRLGVTPRAVRLYKARFNNGGYQCECKEGACLRHVLAKLKAS